MATKEKTKDRSTRRVVAQNRRAKFDFHLLDKFEAGLVLVGSEVKSIRAGKSSLSEAFVRIQKGEAWLHGMHVAEYFEATYNNHTPLRSRKLLLNKAEIRKLARGVEQKGMTIVPSELWLGERGFVKVTLWLAQGKKDHDKRHAIKEREQKREMRAYRAP